MDKRIRSPNYPALSLPDAIDKVTALYRAQHTHPAPREVVARGIGYNSLNGASASAISALQKYGLLERTGDEIRVSERALRILHPHPPEERGAAIREAAQEPPLFAELNERFPGRMPSDDLLRNYLIRNGFAPSAVTSVITAYRETSEMAEREGREHDSLREQPQEHAGMRSSENVETSQPLPLGETKASSPPDLFREMDRLMGPIGPGSLTQRLKVMMTGTSRLRVTADLVHAGEVDKLIKILEANKALLEEDDGAKEVNAAAVDPAPNSEAVGPRYQPERYARAINSPNSAAPEGSQGDQE
jgi:hypothetical protein